MISIRKYLLIMLLAMTAETTAHAQGDAATEYREALQGWARLLNAHVDDQGRVDFYAVSAKPGDLDRFVAAIAGYGPTTQPQDFDDRVAVLAYHINSYNALAMHGVIERDIPDGFTSFFKRASFFKFRDVTVDGDRTNLYDYENKVIRPLDEPRVHFALNCMVRDCPRLPREPFLAARLEAQLESASREFFSKERHLRIDHEKKRIYVSSILDFYTRDFVESGHRRDLPEYINRYLAKPLPDDYEVRYIDYDWRINQAPADAKALSVE